MPFSRQGCARALSCVWCEPGLMTRSGATRRRRLGSSTRPARPRRGVGESAALTNSPGNATLRKYQAAPTARPTVINEKPLAITKNRPRGPCRPAKSCPPSMAGADPHDSWSFLNRSQQLFASRLTPRSGHVQFHTNCVTLRGGRAVTQTPRRVTSGSKQSKVSCSRVRATSLGRNVKDAIRITQRSKSPPRPQRRRPRREGLAGIHVIHIQIGLGRRGSLMSVVRKGPRVLLPVNAFI